MIMGQDWAWMSVGAVNPAPFRASTTSGSKLAESKSAIGGGQTYSLVVSDGNAVTRDWNVVASDGNVEPIYWNAAYPPTAPFNRMRFPFTVTSLSIRHTNDSAVFFFASRADSLNNLFCSNRALHNATQHVAAR